MPDESTELTEAQVRLKKTGDLVQRIDGTEVVVAHYDRASGHLEFATKEASVKLYQQVTARIGTVNQGKEPSGLIIRSFGVKGEARSDVAHAPRRPKLGPLGDASEDVVEWYLKYDMPQAIIRYGIFTDKDGNPIRRPVRRVLESTVDARDEAEDDQLPWIKKGGKGTQEKTPVYREQEVVNKPDGIIARRATQLTFAPNEVVGGFSADDDFDDRLPETEDAP